MNFKPRHVLFALISTLSSQAVANESWCLERTAPGASQATNVTIEAPTNNLSDEWLFDPLIIDSVQNNLQVCQNAAEQCNITTGDLFYVTPYQASSTEFQLSHVRQGRLISTGILKPEKQNGGSRYIYGTIGNLLFFVLYTGENDCGKVEQHAVYNNLNGTNRKCARGTVEIYPSSETNWLENYAPNGKNVKWTKKVCPGGAQPGGGGGHDPPP